MRNILCGLLACTAATISVPGWADSSAREYNLELVRSSVRAALAEFSRQTGLQTGFYPDSPAEEKIVVGPLKGHYTAEAALSELLASSGLSFTRDNERTITVLAPDAATSPRHGNSAVREGMSGDQTKPEFVRLVDRRYRSDALTPLRTQQVAEVRESSTTGSEQQAASEKRRKVDVLAEVIVTGTQIRGIENSTVPVIVLDRAYIDASGLGTTTNLLESLPQNFALANQSGVQVPGVSDSATQGASINLRGIGEGTTLILLNGRRMASGFAGSAVDISALPLGAIQRVEILTDGASARYGSDAIGGVVNFILRDDLEGAETRMRAGLADGGVNEYVVSQALGDTWDSGNALASLEYHKRDLLPSSARDFVPRTSDIGSLFPSDEIYSAMVTGRQALTDTLSVFTDALYTKRNSYNEGGSITLNENTNTHNPQVTATLGLDWALGRGWQVEAAGSYSNNELDQVRQSAQFAVNGGSTLLDASRSRRRK